MCTLSKRTHLPRHTHHQKYAETDEKPFHAAILFLLQRSLESPLIEGLDLVTFPYNEMICSPQSGDIQKMSVTVIVSLKVADFDDWKAVFDSLASSPRGGWYKRQGLSEFLDDPNNPIAIGTAPSKETFLAFFTTPEIQEDQKKAGILGPPEITFLEEA